MIEAFLNTVAVVDTEATSNKPDEAEMVELGVARYKGGTWEVNDSLFKPTNRIPPQCSAVCNITDAMVKDKPTVLKAVDYILGVLDPIDTKFYVAHNAQYDIAVLNSNFKRIDLDFNIERDIGKSSWICTHRLAKRLFAEKEGVQFGQSFLRYYFNLNLDPSLFPHRAGNDALVCAHVLVKLMEEAISQGLIDPDKDVGSQLADLSWAKVPLKVWPYGKHKGKKFSDLDDGFLKWAILNVNDLDESSYSYNPDLAAAVEAEVSSRPNFQL